MDSRPRITFFGSGPVAAESLRLLAQSFDIEAVITKPRPPHHHGDVPVITLAEELGLRTLTASNKKELDELFANKPVQSEVAILIDFGIIVSQAVIDYFPKGIINSHFSILPEWRGADPITFSILSGQKTTGVSLMLLVEAMDEGPLIAYGEYELPSDITTPLLTQHLINLSYALLKEEVPHYLHGERSGAAQTITKREVSYSRKLAKEDGAIDWTKSAAQIEREVRAYLGWPKSYATFNDLEVVITKASVTTESAPSGKLSLINKKLVVGCGEGSLVIEKLKPAGKSEMDAAGFINGYKKYVV